MALIHTTHGDMDAAVLQRITGHEDRPESFVTWVEYRWPGHRVETCAICRETQAREALGTMRDAYGALVRRDAHVILKEPSVTADAIAASIGG
jgi:hypothetical protein